MDYSNARKGLGKVAVAQVFAIIATLLASGTELLIKIIMGFSGKEEVWSGVTFLVLASLLCAFLFVIVMLVSSLISCFGYFQASKDEKEFRKAMLCIVFSGAFSVIGSLFQIPNGTLFTIFTTVSTIIELFVMVFAISGLINLSVGCERPDMAAKGDFVLKVMLITYIIAAMDAIVIRIFELSEHAQLVSIILGAVDLILNVLQLIIFLQYLGQARKMLAVTDGGSA